MIAKKVTRPLSTPVTKANGMAAMGEICILIVEDEPAQLEMLAYNVEAEGYRVLKASDGEEGVLLAEEEQRKSKK